MRLSPVFLSAKHIQKFMIDPYEKARVRLAGSPFRSRFKLTDSERAYLAVHGWNIIRNQAVKIITERLAPAFPEHDGKQTPMRGHVVFKAQHATATCCRSCLEKWYSVPKGRSLTDEEIKAVSKLILGWLQEKAGDLSGFPVTPDLF